MAAIRALHRPFPSRARARRVRRQVRLYGGPIPCRQDPRLRDDGEDDRAVPAAAAGARRAGGQAQSTQAQGGQAAPEHDWDAEFNDPAVDPVDLWAKFDPPTLPRGLLPQVIEEFAFDRGMTMGCDMAGIAVGALAVCAAAIPDDIKLQPKRNDTEWQEAARLWVALIGSASTMKTPMMNAVTKPLRRIDSEMAREYQEAMDE